jgi:serine/threonine-protein kinase
LKKDRRERLADAADARLDIVEALSDHELPIAGTSSSGQSVKPSRYSLIAAVAGTALIVAAVFVAGGSWWVLRRTAPPAVVRLTATPLDGKVGDGSGSRDVEITPDGSRIIYATGTSASTNELYGRSLDQLQAVSLHVTGGFGPFPSPNGAWIGFFGGGSLKKVATSGGPAITICSAPGTFRGATWTSDDTIIFAVSGGNGLMKVSANGGTPETVLRPDAGKGELDFSLPEVLPDGHVIVFTIVPLGGAGQADKLQIAAVDLRTGRRKILLNGGSHARYVRSGHLLYAYAGTLRAVPFDADKLEVRGAPVPVVEHVVTKASGAASYSIAGNGTLVYISGDSVVGGERTLVWVDRQGHEEPLGVPPRAYAYPRISPDGTRVALDIRDQENDVWIWDLRRRTLTRLTFDPGLNRGVAWTPDGQRLAFSSQRNGKENIFWQAADGTGTPEQITEGDRPQLPLSFAPDGKSLIFIEPGNPPYDIGIASVPERKSHLLLHASYSESGGEVSPDGRWLAYDSNESGRPEVYVRPFPNIDTGHSQVSNGGGRRSAWSRDGRELFYLSPEGRLMAVPIEKATTFSPGTPKVVVENSYLTPQEGRAYDVSPDGKRFLMIKDVSSQVATPKQLVVVQNWLEELKARVPTK